MSSDNTEQELVIIDKGVEYPAKPIERERYQRVTKKEIHDFVRWMFKHNDNEEFNKLSNAKISNMYYSETGVYINRETIRRNRKIWKLDNGKIVNTENPHGNRM